MNFYNSISDSDSYPDPHSLELLNPDPDTIQILEQQGGLILEQQGGLITNQNRKHSEFIQA